MKSILISVIVCLCFLSTLFAQKEVAIVKQTLEAPLIDGVIDELWQEAQPYYLQKNFRNETPTLIAYWKMLWDEENIYLLVDVDDDNHWPSWENGRSNWETDNAEVYFDVNDVLEDGGGTYISAGHYQIVGGFSEKGEGIVRQLQNFYMGYTMNGTCSYQLYGEGYVYEYQIPLSNFTDNKGEVISPFILQNRDIGFDVNVVDQDEGITISRNRRVWQNDGRVDENWATMDDAGIVRFEASEPSRDSVVCGTNTPFTFSIGVPDIPITNYSWDLDGGTLLDQRDNTCQAQWDQPGVKNVVLTITDNTQQVTQYSKSLTVYPPFSVSLGDDFTACRNNLVEIVPEIENGILPFTFSWNNVIGGSTCLDSSSRSRNYFLSIRDGAGCVAVNSVYVTRLSQIDPDQIYKVSIENANNKNRIEWIKSSNNDIAEYQILKESNVANQFTLAGTVAYEGDNFFIDESSNPSKFADRYILKTVDKCDNVSAPSTVHKNIHLQVSPGLPGYYNLTWTPYVGFEYGSYYIYKGTTAENMTLIDQISSSITQYTDTSSTQVFYQVSVQRSPQDSTSNKSAMLANEARSNIELASRTANQEYRSKTFSAFPNPTRGTLNLSIDIQNNMTYKVTDIAGKLIDEGKLNKPAMDLSRFKNGLYVVSIFENKNKLGSFQIQKE